MWHRNLDLYFYILNILLIQIYFSWDNKCGLTAGDANRRGTLDSWRSSNTGILHSSHWEQTINMSLRASQNQCLVKSITNDQITIQHFEFFFHYWRWGTPIMNAGWFFFLPWTSSSSSSVRSMTEPFGRPAGVVALEGVDPAAWLSKQKRHFALLIGTDMREIRQS